MPPANPIPASVALVLTGDVLRLATGGRLLGEGSLAPVLASLRHEPPSALEVEEAIAHTEELIMPLLRGLAPGAALHASGAALQALALAAGAPQPTDGASAWQFEPAALERLFERLAQLAGGLPAAHLGLPVDRRFAAILVLVRELLHHGAFRELVITA